jgi:hypothetical protein
MPPSTPREPTWNTGHYFPALRNESNCAAIGGLLCTDDKNLTSLVPSTVPSTLMCNTIIYSERQNELQHNNDTDFVNIDALLDASLDDTTGFLDDEEDDVVNSVWKNMHILLHNDPIDDMPTASTLCRIVVDN